MTGQSSGRSATTTATRSHGARRGLMVVTDLDGSLLDHYTYSYAPAKPMLEQLKADGVPVVLCSSKTRAEMQVLRAELGLTDPYIVENGAAIYVPKTYVPLGAASPLTMPERGEDMGDEWRIAFGEPRTHWQELMRTLPDELRANYRKFAAMTVGQIADLTGLSIEDARRASQREFGEPLHWRGAPADKQRLIDTLQHLGARVLQGGRFLHVAGDFDKGRALKWLANYLGDATGKKPITVALGDSQNDVAMLDAANYAVVIRSPVHEAPRLERDEGVIFTEHTGPRGWAEGLSAVLAEVSSSGK